MPSVHKTSMGKFSLYINTVKHLKIRQVFLRTWRRLGGKTRIGVKLVANPNVKNTCIDRIPSLPELDFDEIFLNRFDCDSILDDRIELLHHEEKVEWNTVWISNLSTPLWQFNLHYCEYLLPLAKRYLDSEDSRYLVKACMIIDSWITTNSQKRGGIGWDPYTISLRTINWLAFLGELKGHLSNAFVSRIDDSLARQYQFLSNHIEVDLLANHYFENLKALTLLAIYFTDEGMLETLIARLNDQIHEQILPDGMHFELSPMYHKIVLEDMLRLATAVRQCNRLEDPASFFKLQDMCDCLYSIERHTNRTPLFNDSGDNVAKSRDALLLCARVHFGINPQYRQDFPCAGYYLMELEHSGHIVKLLFDAGKPGPEYALGHAHCDALSFECFLDGKPWIVNCGTYAYQDEKRLLYKSTASHSTVLLNGAEQAECWGSFRMARMFRTEFLGRIVDESSETLSARMFNYRGAYSTRSITLDDCGLTVFDDSAPSASIEAFFHFASKCTSPDATCREFYAPDFGEKRESYLLRCSCTEPFKVDFQEVFALC